ncbi:MAG: alpha-ketoacid dehydrogenase subunit beta [Planctomycetota bacterium]|jgi:pyruvate dehydrogenase E1 component beta subunit
MAQLNMVEALNKALDDQLAADDRVCVMGEDVAVDGGVFRVTRGLLDKYGKDRVIDTPLAECAIVGTAVGMAIYGLRPVAEIQFSGFTGQAFDQIEQNMARYRNRSRNRFPVSMVVRAPYGGGIRAVEHHSESREAYWAHTPGLKVVIPYEPKAVYRAYREEVPEQPDPIEIGKASIVRAGTDITLIAYGAMMRPVLEAADDLTELHGVQPELIDLLSIAPMDTETIIDSVSRTGRCCTACSRS